MRAVVNFGSVPVKPGHIRLAFHHRPHYIQELHPDSRDAAVGISNVLTECGLDTLHTDQIRNMVWTKAVNNSCMNPVCAVTGKTMAEVINDPILFNLVDNLLKEGVAVARANELSLGPDFYPDCIDYIQTAGQHKPSMLQDIEAGRSTEVDYINGKIIEYAARAGMAAPYNTALRSLVKALEPK
jgi:2-dehydropantoate 2-reductase